MLRHNLKLSLDGPHKVPPPKEGQIFETPPSKETPPIVELANLNVDQVTAERNQMVEKFFKGDETTPLSNIQPNQSPSKYRLDKQWDREERGTVHLYRAKRNRFSEVIKNTTKAIIESLEKEPLQGEFDYWIFREILKLFQILEETHWLQSQLLVNPPGVLEWRECKDESQFAKEFTRMFGPINCKSAQGQKLLRCFIQSWTELEKESNRRLTLVLEFAQKQGKEAAKNFVTKMMEAQMKELDLPNGYTFKLLEELEAHTQRSIYNVDLTTSRLHFEWFLIPRFLKTLGPSALFIRNETMMEKSLVDYKVPAEFEKRVKIIDGYWPTLIDLTFSHPVRWNHDPVKPEKLKKLEEEESGGDLTTSTEESKSRRNWNCLHNHMRVEIKKYLLGIELELFIAEVKKNHGYMEESLFPGMSNQKAVKRLKDLFIRNQLPGREEVILFPVFLRGVIQEGESELAIRILEKVWKKLIFMVRTNGGEVRGDELYQMYSQFWKVKMRVENWGFEGWQDFVGWCMHQWNQDGKGEGLEVGWVVAEKNIDSDPVLVYKSSFC